MKQIIGGRPGPRITTIEDDEEINFEFFYFLGGAIQMKICKNKEKTVVVFESLEDFQKNATEKGLPGIFIGTVSQIY